MPLILRRNAVSNYSWFTIKETDDWIIDYDKNKGRYRISYFEDGHFKDEVIFREYHEDSIS